MVDNFSQRSLEGWGGAGKKFILIYDNDILVIVKLYLRLHKIEFFLPVSFETIASIRNNGDGICRSFG
jgi:hypothetical protein